MTYRGVFRGGVIVVLGKTDMQNGDAVVVSRYQRGSKRRVASKKTSKKKAAKTHSVDAKSKKRHPFMALGGIWKDREDWRGLTSLEVLERIRSGHSGAKPVKKRKGARG